MTDETTLARLERRFEAIESRIAHQEYWLDTLDRAVSAQEQRLAQLERLNNLMQTHLRNQHQWLKSMDPEENGFSEEYEKPPHY
ncbi:SlyX family protein [Halomonas sp. PR-M31]|uniref:SlyX family protein n=1 Tax=Halomonas sp. PR-M31 TaxID=1471202 RepID=UPI0006517C12|nr:SlyX family protein [Halomonas sp. PR-M31]